MKVKEENRAVLNRAEQGSQSLLFQVKRAAQYSEQMSTPVFDSKLVSSLVPDFFKV